MLYTVSEHLSESEFKFKIYPRLHFLQNLILVSSYCAFYVVIDPNSKHMSRSGCGSVYLSLKNVWAWSSHVISSCNFWELTPHTLVVGGCQLLMKGVWSAWLHLNHWRRGCCSRTETTISSETDLTQIKLETYQAMLWFCQIFFLAAVRFYAKSHTHSPGFF